jgi:hypothetical protein
MGHAKACSASPVALLRGWLRGHGHNQTDCYAFNSRQSFFTLILYTLSTLPWLSVPLLKFNTGFVP